MHYRKMQHFSYGLTINQAKTPLFSPFGLWTQLTFVEFHQTFLQNVRSFAKCSLAFQIASGIMTSSLSGLLASIFTRFATFVLLLTICTKACLSPINIWKDERDTISHQKIEPDLWRSTTLFLLSWLIFFKFFSDLMQVTQWSNVFEVLPWNAFTSMFPINSNTVN